VYQPQDTRDRLLRAAETLFAHKGYEATTVREITSAANTNLAAVNYHFGSKKNLYLEVFRQRWIPRARALLEPLEKLASRASVTLEEVVETLITAFMDLAGSSQEWQAHQMLIIRELTRPGPALAMAYEQAIGPLLELASGLLAKVAGVGKKEAVLATLSIIAQSLYLSRIRPVLALRGMGEGLEELLRTHVKNFSLAGVRGLGRGEEQ